MFSRISLMWASSAAAVMTASTPASAQQYPAGAGATPSTPVETSPPFTAAVASAPSGAPQAESGATVGEIVVTANKRKQSINDVGTTITALTSDQLAAKGISDLSSLAQNVPALQFSESANNTPILTLRGVGFFESSLASYPAVSVSLDEAPLAFPSLTSLTAFDLERVEVLKGPQGTLFGQNTTGGAINYIAAKPTSYYTAGGDVSYGRFNTADVNAYVSGPITDTLKARFSTHIKRSDDWQQGYALNQSSGAIQTYAERLLLDWTPTGKLSVNINLNAWQDKSDPQVPQYTGIGIPQQAGYVYPPLLTFPTAPSDARAADYSPDQKPFANNHFYQSVLRVDYRLTHDLTLTSLTSYDAYDTHSEIEGDGTPFQIGDNPQNGSIHDINQEVRLSNGGASHFRWVAGANYSHARVYDNDDVLFGQQSTGIRYGFYNTDITSNQDLNNYAAFGNAEYDFLSKFTIKGGLRYTEADRTAYSCTSGLDNGATSNFLAGTSLVLRQEVLGETNAQFIPIADGQCIALKADYTPSLTPTETKLDENNVSWRAGLDYKAMKGLLLYVNVSKGYKAGSIPRVGATSTSQYVGVKQESVLAYEGGVKLTALDNRLSVTGAGFYYDYTNKQLRTREIDPIFNLLEVLANIPKSRIIGGELEADYRPITGLTLSLAGTYTDSVITDYTGVSAAGIQANFDNTPAPFAPKYEGSASADYTWTLGSVKPFVGAAGSAPRHTLSVIGGPTARFDGGQAFRIRGYSVLDLRAGISAPDDSWRLSVYGKNVLNTYYWNDVITTFETIGRYAGYPVTCGATFSVRFR